MRAELPESVLDGHTTPYGTELAESVAEQLIKGYRMVYRHRDYCGVGLQWESETNRFSMGAAMDGEIAPETTWSREEFVPWLAKQTDRTLHGDGNQRITRARMVTWLPMQAVIPLATNDRLVAEVVINFEAAEARRKGAEALLEANRKAVRLGAGDKRAMKKPDR